MLVSAAWAVPAFLAAINATLQPRIWGDQPASLNNILFVAFDWFLYALLTPGVFALAKRWPLVRPHLVRRAVLHVLLSLLFCLLWASSGTILKAFLQPRTFAQGIWVPIASWMVGTLPFGCAVYLSMVGMEHATRYFSEAREREMQMARLAEQLSGARLAALQAQLNPHFLFNTLNTITVLVREGDRAGASRMIEQLSEMLRRTLSSHRTNEVTLAEELDLVRQYLAIEQVRFSDRLRVEFEIAESVLSAAVPSFALQHLVENAIRHGITKLPEAGRVRVTARRDQDVLELSVSDDGPGVAAGGVMPKGHGIENTRERLAALYGDRASLEVARGAAGGAVATLRVPYREIAGEGNLA